MTVNCLSQYSGCKCILTFTKKTIATSQASPNTFLLMWINEESSDDRHITYGTLMISWMCLSIDFIFLLYNSEILGRCKTEESVYFGVCCSASNVCSHSLWESTPTMHCMDLMHHVSYSLWADGKKKSAYTFWLWFFWLIWNFPMLACSCCFMLGW